MSKKNPEYDFKWCPGCGDFGVRRALEFAMIDRLEETGLPIENQRGCRRNRLLRQSGPPPGRRSTLRVPRHPREITAHLIGSEDGPARP